MERLNKYLAHAGVGSRRHCDDMILHGRVAVDGQTVRELGTRIDPEQQKVSVDGKPLHVERPVYWLVNKPRGYLCTNSDPAGRPLATDLVEHVPERVYTVGRLDEDSEGLLLLTNDGDLAFRLMHPRFGIRKTYLVQVAGKPSKEDMERLIEGVWLSDGHVKAQRVKRLKSQGDSTWLEIVLSEGKNREVRRMLAKLEHKVMRLRRIAIGPLKLDRLPKGKSRRLKHDEVEFLRAVVERAGKPRPKGPAKDAEPKASVEERPAGPKVEPARTPGGKPGPRRRPEPRNGPRPARQEQRREGQRTS